METIRVFGSRRWVRHGVVPFAFYLAATLAITYPLVTQLATHLPNKIHGDGFEAVRLIWWTREAIFNGMHPAYQPLLAYPAGFFSPVQWAAPLAHLAGLPFALLFSPLLAYNLTFIASWVLTGLAAYLLCWELTGRQLAALLGGLILMAFPTRQGHAVSGHLTLITNYWLVLYTWSLVRFWRGPTRRRGIVAGILLVCTAGTHVTSLSYELVPLTAGFVLLLFWRQRKQWRIWLRPLLALAGVAAVGGLILYAPLLVGLSAGQLANLQAGGTDWYSTDLLAFITPSPFNSVLRQANLVPGWALDILTDNHAEGSAYLGLAAVTLSVLALWKRRRSAAPWLLLALVSMWLSLGPTLKVGGRVVEVPLGDGLTPVFLPYTWYSAIPGMSMGRTPGRFNLLTGLALAVLAAYGLSWLLDRGAVTRRRAVRAGLAIGIAAVIMVEYQLITPFPTTPAPQPAYFENLAADAASGRERVVLDLPARDFLVTRWQLYYQTAHHQPILTGHVIRFSPVSFDLQVLVDAAALPPVAHGLVPILTVEQQAALLRTVGADVVVVHRTAADGPAMAAHLVTVLGAPVYEDDRVTIFTLPSGPDLQVPVYALQVAADTPDRTASWWHEGAGFDGWWLGLLRDRLVNLPPVSPDYPRVLESRSTLGGHHVRVVFGQAAGDSLAGDWPGKSVHWLYSAYLPGEGVQPVHIWVDEGVAGCALLPDDPACGLIGPPMVDQIVGQRLDVTFGDGQMRFVSYVVHPAAPDHYHLDLYWQAGAGMRPDFVMFIHLFNDRDELVAQWDGPLGGLALPTSAWEPGVIHVQDAVLALPEGLEPGSYRLFTGLYTFPDLTRLPVNSDRPGAPDGILYLQDLAIPPAPVD